MLAWIQKTIGGLFRGVLAARLGRWREKLCRGIEAAPGNLARLWLALVSLGLLVVLLGLGAVMLPVGLILVATQMAADDVNKVSLAGELLAWLGAAYMGLPLILILSFSALAHGRMKKTAGALVRKIERRA